MKKIFLAICLMFILIKPVNAELANPTVEEAYLMVKRENKDTHQLYEEMILASNITGQLSFAIFNAVILKNNKTLECLNKPPRVWFDLVFDDYKNDKIKGSSPFYYSITSTIWNKCFVPYVK